MAGSRNYSTNVEKYLDENIYVTSRWLACKLNIKTEEACRYYFICSFSFLSDDLMLVFLVST
jgi:hypothetical protein